MDGEVVIKTRLDLEQFEKDLKTLNKQQINDLQVKLNLNLDNLKKQRNEIAKEMQPLTDKISELSQGKLKEKVLAMPEFQEASAKLKELEPQLESVAQKITSEQMKLEAINNYIMETPELQEVVKEKVEETTQAIEKETEAQKELNNVTKDDSGVKQQIDDIKTKTDSVGKSFSSIGTIISGLALAGFVGAIGLAGSKSETAKKQFEEISMWIKHIGEDLLNLIMPVAEFIVNLLYEAVKWLGKLLQDWFGIDIFSKRASDNIKKTVKSAKALRKQLLGFDEMNILNKDGTIGGLGSSTTNGKTSGGTKDPSSNIKTQLKEAGKKLIGDWQIEQDEEQNIVNDILDDLFLQEGFGKLLREKGILRYTGPKHLTQQYQYAFDSIRDYLNESMVEIQDGWVTIQHEGAETIKMTTVEYEAMLNALSQRRVTNNLQAKQFDKVLQGLNQFRQKQQIKKMGKEAQKSGKQIGTFTEYLSNSEPFKNFYDWLNKDTNNITKFTTSYKNGIYTIKTDTGKTFKLTKDEYNAFSPFLEQKLEEYKKIVGSGSSSLGSIIMKFLGDNKKTAKKVLDESVIDYKDGMYTITTATGQTFKLTEKEMDALTNYIGYDMDKIRKKTNTTNDQIVKDVENKFNKLKDLGKNPVEEIGKGAVTAADSIRNQIAKITGEDLPTEVEKGLTKVNKKLIEWAVPETAFSTNIQNIGKTAGTSVAKGLANGVNSALSKIESGMNSAVSSINQLMSNMGSSAVMGAYAIAGKVNKLSKLKLPRIKLAKGGIINNPGPGVAVGGERGAEWYQPLTDTQSLDMVANAIGKRISLQPRIDVYVGNRLVQRETRRIDAQDQFAYNGGL